MKINILHLKTALILFMLFLPIFTMAHSYWLEVKGSGKIGESAKILLFYGEYSNQERMTGKFLDKMADIQISVVDATGNKIEIKMTQTNTHWEGIFTPKTGGIYQILGINDQREVQDWTKHGLDITRPVQFLRTIYQVGKIGNYSNTLHFLDVIVKQQAENVILTAFKDKIAFAKAKLTIVNPQGWEKAKFSNEKGEISFSPSEKGLYLVELEWIDKTPGIYKGKEYQSIRYRCDVSITLE